MNLLRYWVHCISARLRGGSAGAPPAMRTKKAGRIGRALVRATVLSARSPRPGARARAAARRAFYSAGAALRQGWRRSACQR